MYVIERDAESNRVVVGPREALARQRVALADVRLHRPADQVETVRLRYHARPLACRAVPADAGLLLELEEPALAVAPGQLACLMREDVVVGEGTIEELA
jgi:tRNA-specific 2-thiouridylase